MKFKKVISSVAAFAMAATMAVMPTMAEAADKTIVYDEYKTSGANNMLRIYLDEIMEKGEVYEFSFNVKPDSIDVYNSVRVDLGFQGNTTSPGNFGVFYLYENAKNALGTSNYNLIGNVEEYREAVAEQGIDMKMVWDTNSGSVDITAGFPGKEYNYAYMPGIVPDGGSYGSFIVWSESTAVTITDLSIQKRVEEEADPNAPIYKKEGNWEISGEHNYITAGSGVGMEAGGKYVLEFGVLAPTGNPSFYFDWRDYANNTKSGIASWNYKAVTGIYDDGSNDCIAIGPLPWAKTVSRGGSQTEYNYSIVWDTATAKFDVTIDYKTGAGVTGTITGSCTGSGTFAANDVLKFATNGGKAIIKDLAVYNYVEPEVEPEPDLGLEDYYLESHTTTGGGNILNISLNDKMENGGTYELSWNIKPESLSGMTVRCDVMYGNGTNQGNYGFFVLYDNGVNALGMSDYAKIGKVEEHTAEVVEKGIDMKMLWNTVTGVADITVKFPTGKEYKYTWNAGVIPEGGSFGSLLLQSISSKATITNLSIKETGETVAPALTSDDIKIYADDTLQVAAGASAFTNKIVVDFGQRMKKADMTEDYIYVTEKESGEKVEVGRYTYADGVMTIEFRDGFEAEKTYTVNVESVRNSGGVRTESYAKDFAVKGGVNAQLVNVVQSGSEVTSAAALNAGVAKLNVRYSNTLDNSPVLYVIAAYYNGGELVLADYFDWSVDTGADSINYEFNYTVENVEGGYDEVQFMVWDGFDTMKPLSTPITLK